MEERSSFFAHLCSSLASISFRKRKFYQRQDLLKEKLEGKTVIIVNAPDSKAKKALASFFPRADLAFLSSGEEELPSIAALNNQKTLVVFLLGVGIPLEEQGKRIALVRKLAVTEKARIVPVWLEKFHGFYKADIGLPLDDLGLTDQIKSLYALRKQLKLFVKYKDYRHVLGRYLFFIIMKAFVLSVYAAVVFPTTYLYENDKAKGARKPAGPGIAIANHTSFADAEQFPRTYIKRHIYLVVGHAVYYNNGPILKWILKTGNAIVVNDSDDPSGSSSFEGLVKADEMLKANLLIGIFPSGKISPIGDLAPFRKGVGALGVMEGCKIYPSCVLKEYRHFRRQYVMIGEPIDPAELFKGQEMSNSEKAEKLTSYLEYDMRKLYEAGNKLLAEKKKA